MGRGTAFSVEERRVISSMKQQGVSCREIARHLNRSFSSVAKFVRMGPNYGTGRSSGRPPALTPRDKRHILRTASNSCLSAKGIAERAGVKTNVRNVQRFLKASKHLKRQKIKRKPALTNAHKAHRLQIAKNRMAWQKEWRRVIFSDEKKFNLDGPDGFCYYYHDLRKDEKILSRRQMGGGSVMIWACIGYKKKGDIVFLPRKINAEAYRDMLDEQKWEFEEMSEGEPIFQQDNAAIHTADIIKDWSLRNQIEALEWPAKSPDLNIIENLWGLLARKVYADGKQYNSIQELKLAIQQAWKEIPQETIQKLYDSLPTRMFEVIKRQGNATKY